MQSVYQKSYAHLQDNQQIVYLNICRFLDYTQFPKKEQNEVKSNK